MSRNVRLLALLVAGLAVLTLSAALPAAEQPTLRTATAPQPIRPSADERTVKTQAPSGKTDGQFDRTPMPLDWQVEQLRKLVQQLSTRVAQLEAAQQPGQSPVNAIHERLGRLESALQITPGGLILASPGALTLTASAITLNSGTVTLNAGTTQASGVLRSDTLITNSVVASQYTPGAGNVW